MALFCETVWHNSNIFCTFGTKLDYAKLFRMKTTTTIRDHSLLLKAFRAYLIYVNTGLYFRREHIVGLENLPPNGTPLLIVSNHQNCLNDPLCVCLALTDRRMNFIARANVFQRPIFNKALRAMGLLPAYRMSFEGYAAVNKNRETMDDASQAISDGETLMMFPEAGHQDKRWLGEFKLGYLRIAFDAAEKLNFERDVMIVPSCNHYACYFHARSRMLIKFGKPLSLRQYYDSYREAPRETLAKVNMLVRSKIDELMLNIEDLDNYDEIDFLRNSEYGDIYAFEHGFKPSYLPARLLADKQLVVALKEAANKHPEEMKHIYADTRHLRNEMERINIRDWLFKRKPSSATLTLRALVLFALLPLFVIAIIPTALLFIIPKIFIARLIKDRMFLGSFNLAVSALITIPICQFLASILIWIFCGGWWALGYFVAFPLMFLFAWEYIRLLHKFVGTRNFTSSRNRAEIARLDALRNSIFERLADLVK